MLGFGLTHNPITQAEGPSELVHLVLQGAGGLDEGDQPQHDERHGTSEILPMNNLFASLPDRHLLDAPEGHGTPLPLSVWAIFPFLVKPGVHVPRDVRYSLLRQQFVSFDWTLSCSFGGPGAPGAITIRSVLRV